MCIRDRYHVHTNDNYKREGEHYSRVDVDSGELVRRLGTRGHVLLVGYDPDLPPQTNRYQQRAAQGYPSPVCARLVVHLDHVVRHVLVQFDGSVFQFVLVKHAVVYRAQRRHRITPAHFDLRLRYRYFQVLHVLVVVITLLKIVIAITIVTIETVYFARHQYLRYVVERRDLYGYLFFSFTSFDFFFVYL